MNRLLEFKATDLDGVLDAKLARTDEAKPRAIKVDILYIARASNGARQQRENGHGEGDRH